MAWIKITKDSNKLPKKGEVVDVWANGRRHTDYTLILDYGGTKGNNFFSPVYGGISCIRYGDQSPLIRATHWMYTPSAPKN